MHPRNDKSRRCRPVDEWPVNDQIAWHGAHEPGDFLEPDGPATHWSDYTSRKVAKGWGRYLTWLDAEGYLDPNSGPDNRVTLERVVAYVTHLQSLNAPMTVLTRLGDLDMALRAMAPEVSRLFLRRLMARLRSRTKDSRNKRQRVVPSSDLLGLGLSLMDSAAAGNGTPLQNAINYRDGLAIALLAARPLRRKNFAAIEFDRHLAKLNGQWWITIPGDETKTGAPIEQPLPEEIGPYLVAYLTDHRPLLASRKGRWHRPAENALWVSKDGSPMTEIGLYFRIMKWTTKAFGHCVNPHLFRDAAMTSLAIEDPANVRAGAALLGHSNFRTSERYYNLGGTMEAATAYHKTLSRRRRKK